MSIGESIHERISNDVWHMGEPVFYFVRDNVSPQLTLIISNLIRVSVLTSLEEINENW